MFNGHIGCWWWGGVVVGGLAVEWITEEAMRRPPAISNIRSGVPDRKGRTDIAEALSLGLQDDVHMSQRSSRIAWPASKSTQRKWPRNPWLHCCGILRVALERWVSACLLSLRKQEATS